ncbi:hypothetical protein [Streptomyces sirii]
MDVEPPPHLFGRLPAHAIPMARPITCTPYGSPSTTPVGAAWKA